MRLWLRVPVLLWVALLAAAAEDSFTGVGRIVAVGDVHGDHQAVVSLLRSAGLVNAEGRWTGGKTHLVQTGDFLDRGPDSRKVMDLFMRLEDEAGKAGGRVHVLIGNHEAMNVYGDMRYVSAGEYAAFRTANSERVRELYYAEHIKQARAANNGPTRIDEEYKRQWMSKHPPGYFEHRMAFAQDGEYGKWIRRLNAIIRINDTVFVHGGLSPKYADRKLDDINRQVREELRDFSRLQGGIVMDPEGPLWYRGLAQGDEEPLREHLASVLERLKASRMVIAHTVTKGMVTPRFEGKVLMIDVGLSQYYGARPACLLVETGKEYALHRGSKLELPKTPAEQIRYLRQVAQVDAVAPAP